MATIIFRPTCSKCGHILVNQKVDFESEKEDLYWNDKVLSQTLSCNITPRFCAYCGERFCNIAVPSSFPVSDRALRIAARSAEYKETIC